MPPSSILSSMRYLPASTCPTSRSPLPARLRTAPSAGHSVVVSAYCLPHVGQVFIEERVPPSTSVVRGDLSVSHRFHAAQRIHAAPYCTRLIRQTFPFAAPPRPRLVSSGARLTRSVKFR